MNPVNQPLRVLQVVTNMDRGGLETMLMNYYRQIDRTKVQFDFLTHREEKADYDDEITALGGIIYHLPRLVPWSKSYRKALEDFFAAHPEYSVIHVHQDCLSVVVLKAAKKQGVPVRIAHSHNADQDKNLKYPIKLFYKRFIAKYATTLMACSHKAGDWMFGGAKYSILSNAIDASAYRFDPEARKRMRAAWKLSPQTLVLGHVGRFMPQKNHAFLIDLFYEVQKLRPDARLMLVGGGSLEPEIRQQAEKLGILDKIIFTGVRSDVNELLQAMDVFVLPSHYEGLGIVNIEAQAAGLPCFVSAKVVPPEAKVTELLQYIPLEAGAKAWAEQIVAGVIPPEKRRNTTEEIIRAGFDIHATAAELEQFYRKVGEKHRE